MFLSTVLLKKRQVRSLRVYLRLGFVVAIVVIMLNCGGNDTATMNGEQLAKTYCASCHQFPEPSLLPKSIWEKGVLPKMALRLGFLSDTLSIMNYQQQLEDLQEGIKLGVFPAEPPISQADWLKIVDYYKTQAPEKPLPQASKPAIEPQLPSFQVKKANHWMEPLTTMVKYDSATQHILTGSRRGYMLRLNPRLTVTDSLNLGSPPSDVRGHKDGQYDILLMGFMDPNNKALGSVGTWKAGQSATTSVLAGLRRPVQMAYADLNRDGQEDVLISQFGHLVGKLSVFYRNGNSYREEVIDPVPGARRAIVQDMNKDGWPDVLALLAQGDEQIALYVNQQGKFVKQTLVRFSSVYGSSYFEVADIDRDGDADLVYTNGDNADYSYSLKAYHGVRIFVNDGKLNFKQAWFYPMHGASQVLARDFDQDGDLDLAAISFFPDYARTPSESFLYFENQGNLQFKTRTFPQAEDGRWLVMDAADVDRDGDEDLLLGSFYYSVTKTPEAFMARWRKVGNGVLLLENKTK